MYTSLQPTRTPLSSQTHDYRRFSGEYSHLGIENTYFLAFKSVAELLGLQGDRGKRALDFGCGTGRSTRFLQSLGFDTVGVDINPSMLSQARRTRDGEYYQLNSKKLPFPAQRFDLIFQSFVLFEYGSLSQTIDTFEELNRVLADRGIVIVVTGSEDYYVRDWLSFKMDDSRERPLKSGDTVKVSIRGTDIVLFDYYWTDRDYRQVFQQSGFKVVETLHPLARGDEPFAWVSECEFPCWTIYVIEKQ
ncbi:MAG: class I SAM-dependent methyltransferase [Spirulina sp.]